MGLVAAAGKSAEEIAVFGVKFEEMHRGGWDPDARLADQDRDGVAGEILYPTVGMVLCNHRDFDYKKACFDAYNLWIAEYASRHPERLFGIGQTAVRSVPEAIADLERIRELGLRGVMMPGEPQHEDYDHPMYDPLWQAAIDLGLPLSFHILTTRESRRDARPAAQLLPLHHPRLPGPDGAVRLQRRLRALPGAQDRVRRGGRRLGPALHVPDGPRLRPAPLLAAGRHALEAPERVLRREHLRHLSRRLGGLPDHAPVQPAAADVGERLPAQRLDLAAVAGGDPRADAAASPDAGAPLDPARQRGRALRAREPAEAKPHGLRPQDRGRNPRSTAAGSRGGAATSASATGASPRSATRPGARARRSTRPAASSPRASSTSTPTTTPRCMWDRMLSISPWHGVTTVVIGNCGFGVAPTRPEHRELILRTLEKVEGMSFDALDGRPGPRLALRDLPRVPRRDRASRRRDQRGACCSATPRFGST